MSAWSAARGRPARPGRAARAAPPGRAARGAGRDRASGAGAALGERRVAVVHVGGDVVEQERLLANGEARAVSTPWMAISRRATPPRISRSAGRSKTSDRHSRYVSTRIGNAAVARGDREQVGRRAGAAARAACACPGRRRGSSSARAAFSRKRVANSADVAELADDEVLDLVRGSGNSSASIVRRAARRPRGRRIAMPSSDQIVWTSTPSRSPRRASIASDHGAWTRPPNGRQEARAASRRARRGSARRRSACRSAGRRRPRARRRGRRRRFSAASSSRSCVLARAARERATARPRRRAPGRASSLADERRRAPGRARSAARPRRPSRTAACRARPAPARRSPGRGAISSIRQLLAPRTMTSPCIPARSS